MLILGSLIDILHLHIEPQYITKIRIQGIFLYIEAQRGSVKCQLTLPKFNMLFF